MPIPEFWHRYSISPDGDVYSHLSEQYLKQRDNGKGYKTVALTNSKGKRKIFYVHRLVAFSYLGVPTYQCEVNHINKIRSDNRVENLEYCSTTENEVKKLQGKKRGVYWFKLRKKWRASIKINGKEKHLGLFEVKEEAYTAYFNAFTKHHGFKPW